MRPFAEYPANARLHPDQNLDAIVSSLHRFGQAEPLVIQSGTNRVIAGNGRMVAMRQLGWEACDVIELEVDDLTATALGIALNRTAELATWDEGVLARLLGELREQDALDGVGFETDEIDALLAEMGGNAQGEVDDPGPGEPPAVPVSRPGRSLDPPRPPPAPRRCVPCRGPGASHGRRPGGPARHRSPLLCFIHGHRPAPVLREGLVPRLPRDRHQGPRRVLDSVLTAALPHVVDDAAVYMWHAHLQQPVIAATFENHGLLLRDAGFSLGRLLLSLLLVVFCGLVSLHFGAPRNPLSARRRPTDDAFDRCDGIVQVLRKAYALSIQEQKQPFRNDKGYDPAESSTEQSSERPVRAVLGLDAPNDSPDRHPRSGAGPQDPPGDRVLVRLDHSSFLVVGAVRTRVKNKLNAIVCRPSTARPPARW